MQPAVTWTDVTSLLSAWVPTDRHPAWSNRKVIYWKCSESNAYLTKGYVVDPQLHDLGQHSGTRTLRVLTETIHFHHAEGGSFRPGCYYVAFGSLVPIWHQDVQRWEVAMPKTASRSGCCRVLGDHLQDQGFRAAELFGGHLGGWRAASEVVEGWSFDIAVDNNPSAVASYCRNYGGIAVEHPQLLNEASSKHDLVICSDIADLRWLHSLNHKEINVFTVSAPCQSWSSMGSGSGTNSPNGQALIAAVQTIRLVQPLLVLVEQVSGFRTHGEFDDFVKTMSEAGFRLAVSGMHELSLVTYTSRKRWLAVFINTLHVSSWEYLGKFMSPIIKEECVFKAADHCLPFMQQKHLDEVAISADEAGILGDPVLLPKWKRQTLGPGMSAMKARVISDGVALPTINASYRRSTRFSRDLLQSKGLMAWIIQDSRGELRWLQKFEALKAMGFRLSMALPATEEEAFEAIGNSISPFHSALAMTCASSFLAVQRGSHLSSKFREAVKDLREQQGSLHDAVIHEGDGSYHTLVHRSLPRDFQTLCPLCKKPSRLPLVQACRYCGVIACTDCVSTECRIEHRRLLYPHDQEVLTVEDSPPRGEGAQFCLTDLETGETHHLWAKDYDSVASCFRDLKISQSAWLFLCQGQISFNYAPAHGDEFYFTNAFPVDAPCPSCGRGGVEECRKLCHRCRKVGCKFCVADSCMRCTRMKQTCRTCHEQLAEEHLRNLHDEMLQLQDADALGQSTDWDVVLQCDVEAQWRHVVVLAFPVGRATVHRGMFADRNHILRRLAVAGYETSEHSVIFWGKSVRPSLHEALHKFIVVVPKDELTLGIIPVVVTSSDGDCVLCLPNPQTAEAWCLAALSPRERERGYFVVCEDEELAGPDVVSLQPGAVLVKVAPCYRGPTSAGSISNRPPTRQATVAGPRQCHITGISGVVNLDGKFRALPRPRVGQTWPEWLGGHGQEFLQQVWATTDGRYLPFDAPLTGAPLILRLHYRIRGGGKPNARSDALLRKLSEHLIEKGVPQDVAMERASKVVDTIGSAAVQAAYSTVDPWRSLKEATKDRMRLVLHEELRMTKYKQKQVDKGVDPWLTNDPWKSSKEEEVGEEDMSIALIPGSFVGETGQPIPILPHLAAEAYGVAVLSVQEAETFAKSEVNMSDDELAAVVIAVEPPVVGSRRCELITFPASSGDSKILLKGHLVDFGGKPVRLQDTAFSIDIDERQIAVLALEIRREYLQDWQQVAKNPLKHAFAMVDGLQAAVITTWARRFYDGRKMSSADQAATFHAFLKIPQDSLEKILPSSGKGAVFLTPKQGETGLLLAITAWPGWTLRTCRKLRLYIESMQSFWGWYVDVPPWG